ncbi:hypothetical protein SB861_25520 [Paraburkholderia sp. SIMBA_049]
MVSVRDEPIATEIYGISKGIFGKLSQWRTTIINVRSSAGRLRNFHSAHFSCHIFNRPFSHREYGINRFNVPFPIGSENFLSFEEMIFLKFTYTSNKFEPKKIFDTNGRRKNYDQCIALCISRISDAFGVKPLNEPSEILPDYPSELDVLPRHPAPITAMAILQLILEKRRWVRNHRLEQHLMQCGFRISSCVSSKPDFMFSILALYSILLDFVVTKGLSAPISIRDLVKAVDLLNIGLNVGGHLAAATLAVPATTEFKRLTSRGIFRRWKCNFAIDLS